MAEGIRLYWRRAADFLQTRSPEEREKRAAHGFALLLVLAVALAKYVSGVTVDRAPFTLYALAIAASAARGGFGSGFVATLASLLVGGLVAPPAVAGHPRLLFAVEGLLVAVVVSALRSRLHWVAGRLEAAEAKIAELKLRDRHGRLLDAALQHLEETAAESAIVVLNEAGVITEWRTSAERLYGYTADDLVGNQATCLFFETLSPGDLAALLQQSMEEGALRRSDVHRRRDGSRVHVELEIKPVREGDARGFTLAVHDVATRREWDDYRDAARRAQAALQQAADDARQQLAALETLTDPSLNPLGGTPMVIELLERLRATIGADGVALVRPRRRDAAVVAARGLQPTPGSNGGDAPQMAPGRVAVVHNDPSRVEQLSALCWPAGVTSLLVVPVVHDGKVSSTIEVVSQRSRHVTDWDVALVRIVADRLAAVVVQDPGLAKAS